MTNPILFFDENCPFCCFCVQVMSDWLENTVVVFAPLRGITAKKYLKVLPKNTVVFYEPEKKKPAIYAKAIFLALSYRWSFFAKLASIAFLFNPFYRFIADIRGLLPIKKRKPHGRSFLP